MTTFDFTMLEPTEHMFRWLAHEPTEVIRSQVAAILDEQVPGSKLTGFRVTSEPQWLTGARRGDGDPNIVILVRAGAAFEFSLDVESPEGRSFNLNGVYSWVGVRLDEPGEAARREWFDLDGTLEEFGADGALKQRVYFEKLGAS